MSQLDGDAYGDLDKALKACTGYARQGMFRDFGYMLCLHLRVAYGAA